MFRRSFNLFHISSKFPRKSSSTWSPSRPRSAFEVAHVAPISTTSRLNSYYEVVLAPSTKDRLAHTPDLYIPAPAMARELLVAVLSAEQLIIVLRHDEVLALPPLVSFDVICIVIYFAWCDEVYKHHFVPPGRIK